MTCNENYIIMINISINNCLERKQNQYFSMSKSIFTPAFGAWAYSRNLLYNKFIIITSILK